MACKAGQAHKSSYRTGETVQQTFYMYREEVFNKSVLSVERNGYHITTTTIEYGLHKENIFVSFPGE